MRHAPHVIELVRSLKSKRQTNAEIADYLGISERAVRKICVRHQIKLPFPPETLTLRLSAKVHLALAEHAAQRRTKTPRFVRTILSRIVEDNLFLAVLDDAE
jgi:hypothetical protein